MKHPLLMMVLCCALPLGVIFFLPYLGLTSWSGSLLLVVLLLYPLLPLGLLFFHRHGQQLPKHKGGELR